MFSSHINNKSYSLQILMTRKIKKKKNSRLEEMLETSEVMMGNDPMAKNMQQILKGVKKLEMYDILTMLQFKTKLTDLFINWQPVSEFLSQIGLDDQTINSLGTANLNIPGVRNLYNLNFFRSNLI